MEPIVDIAFDCLPLRLVPRIDIPLDASRELRERRELMRQAINAHGPDNTYFLYNTRCVFRLANSDVENMLRFTFDGTIITDRSDCKAEQAELNIMLVAETCGGIPSAALDWLRKIVRRAVLIEFDRFLADSQLANQLRGFEESFGITDAAGFAGMNV